MAMSTQRHDFFSLYIQNLEGFLQSKEQELLEIEHQTSGSDDENIQSILAEQQAYFDLQLNQQMAVLIRHGYTVLTADQRAEEGSSLRMALQHFINQAPFLARSIAKLCARACDPGLMYMMYDGGWQGDTLMGKLLHKYWIESLPAKAMRNRRALFAGELISLWQRRRSSHFDDAFDVMSIACGSAHEVADVIASQSATLKFTLVDQNPHVMHEAREAVGAAQDEAQSRCEVNFVCEPLETFHAPKDFEIMQSQLGRFDFIYSTTLYDYVDQDIARRLTTSLLTLLRPGGVLLLCSFWSRNNNWEICLEYWGDWPLVYRSEETFHGLVEASLVDEVTLWAEPSGCQLFMRAIRSSKPTPDLRSPVVHQS